MAACLICSGGFPGNGSREAKYERPIREWVGILAPYAGITQIRFNGIRFAISALGHPDKKDQSVVKFTHFCNRYPNSPHLQKVSGSLSGKLNF